jgi:hypothetical protein
VRTMWLYGDKLMRKLLICSVVILMLGGCSQKTAYNHLDLLVAEYLDDYVELNDIQQVSLEKSLNGTLAWHRAEQLPAAIEWLQSLKQDLGEELTYDKVAFHADQLLMFWNAIEGQFANNMAVLLPTLSVEQRKELLASFAEKNDEFREEYIDIGQKDRREQLVERVEESFERWLDDLTEDQIAQIHATTHKMEDTAPNMLAMRIQWQQELLQLLDDHVDDSAGKSDVHLAIVNVFVQRNALRSEAYQQQLETNQDLIYRLIVNISKTLEAEQKEYLVSRIDHYIELFKSLVKDGQQETLLREAMSSQ